MNIYFPLTSQFLTQSEPAYCGLTSMAMALNALHVDPTHFRWKGGWRWFTEEVFISQCSSHGEIEMIKREGITMDDFYRLGRLHGLDLSMTRVDDELDDMEPPGVDVFRDAVRRSCEGHMEGEVDEASDNDNNKCCSGCNDVSGAEQDGDGVRSGEERSDELRERGGGRSASNAVTSVRNNSCSQFCCCF